MRFILRFRDPSGVMSRSGLIYQGISERMHGREKTHHIGSFPKDILNFQDKAVFFCVFSEQSYQSYAVELGFLSVIVRNITQKVGLPSDMSFVGKVCCSN